MNKKFLFAAVMMTATVILVSCIKKDDDEVVLNENVETFQIDNSFKASSTYLHGAWQGEYSGYDENQKSNTNIRRLLELYSDGTYKNTIQGILVSKSSNKSDYVDFEIETGTWTYNGSDRITYKVLEDKLINYQTEELETFTKKHSFSGSSTDTSKDVSTYSEGVQFQTTNSDHQWVTKDVYLSNLKGSDLDLFFIQKKQ